MRTLFPLVALLVSLGSAAAQDWAKERLEKSPRHGEWVTVKNGDREIKCYVVYPEEKAPKLAVVVIHEIFGLTDWVRGVADQLAEAGYVAIAPDFLSGQTFSGVDEARKAISELPAEQVMADTDAAANYVKTLPAVNGAVAVGGFCWGGAKAFAYAAHNPTIRAAFVFYGAGPQDETGVTPIACPVYGYYAENDARVNETIPKTAELMKVAGKTFDYTIYQGAGHGFMRAGEAPDASEANRKARDEAWARWKQELPALSK